MEGDAQVQVAADKVWLVMPPEPEKLFAKHPHAEPVCPHAVIRIETFCCQERYREMKVAVPAVRPLPDFQTQLLPQVNKQVNGKVFGTAVVPELDPETVIEERVSRRRHRKDDEDEGRVDMKDLVLGGLVGAAVAIFVAGLLLALFIS